MNIENTMGWLKADILAETDIMIDFREHVYLENSHGCTPTFSYELAKKIIAATYNFCEQYIDDFKHNFPDFNGWQYNLEMECDKLRSTKLKDFILDKLYTLDAREILTN